MLAPSIPPGSLLAETQDHKIPFCWLDPWNLEDLGRRQGRIMVAQLHLMFKSVLDTGVAFKRAKEVQEGFFFLMNTCLLCTCKIRIQARRGASPGHSFGRSLNARPWKI